MGIRLQGLGVRSTRWLAVACAVASVSAVWVHTTKNNTSQTSAWLLHTGLPAGMVVTSSDVSHVHVNVPDAANAGLLQAHPVGMRLAVAVGAGALLRRTDIASHTALGVRDVSVTIEGGHVPLSLKRGASVDVWVTPNSILSSDGITKSVQVATSVVVKSASQPGPTGSVTVELQVPERRVSALVAASHAGAVDLVAVPGMDSAGAR